MSYSSAMFYKGDNFCDLLCAFLHTEPLLKRGLFQKERICSLGSKFSSFRVDPQGANSFLFE